MTEETVTITRQNPLWATGRRKNAIARVRVVPGEGRILVNSKSLEEYFAGHERQKMNVMAPIKLGKSMNEYDLIISTTGGGVNGQSEAIRLGIARAMVSMDPKMRPVMRSKGFMTRDPRMVERKKSGQPKARARFQHSKR